MNTKKITVASLLALVAVATVLPAVSHAQFSSSTAASILDTAVTDVGGVLTSYVPQVVAIAIGLAVVYIGWRLFKRFVK